MSDNELDTTVDEWQAEMDKLDKGDDGKTITELTEELGVHKTTMRDLILKLLLAGKCKQGKGIRLDSMGRRQHMAVYQLKKEKK